MLTLKIELSILKIENFGPQNHMEPQIPYEPEQPYTQKLTIGIAFQYMG